MTEQGRAGTFALAELCGLFACSALSVDGKERIGAEAIKRYSDFLLKAEVLSQEELAALWRQNSDPILLLRGAREACVEMTAGLLGGRVRYAFLNVLSQAEGVRLGPAAASRCLRLMERLEKLQAPFTKKELAARRAAPDQDSLLDVPQLKAALEQAAAGGAEREDGRALASLGCALAYGMTFSFARDGISLPLFGRYAAAVSAAGFRGHRELAKMWNETEGAARPMRDACQQTGASAAATLSHYLGMLASDLLGRIDGVALSVAGAEQALAMLKRAQEGEDVLTESERRRLDKEFAAEFKGGSDRVKEELRRIAAAATVH